MDELQECLQDRKHDMVGRLTILAPLGFGREYIAPLAGQFQARHQHLSVELALSDSPNRSSGLTWDIMIQIGELRDSSLACTRLARNGRFLCA
jgi:DNA-binding transcriptional LysR family regulator